MSDIFALIASHEAVCYMHSDELGAVVDMELSSMFAHYLPACELALRSLISPSTAPAADASMHDADDAGAGSEAATWDPCG